MPTKKHTEFLAKLIVGLGKYDGYNTSEMQTAANLNSSEDEQKFTNESDEIIFKDLVKAIDYASTQKAVTLEVIKNINAQMNSGAQNQPKNPGILRNNFPIHAGAYTPPLTVTDEMVNEQLSHIRNNSVEASWEMYARLAKLQAFDNGNKRTALLSANVHSGSLLNEKKPKILIPEPRMARLQFDNNLALYYLAKDGSKYEMNEDEALKQFVDFATKQTQIQMETKPLKLDTQVSDITVAFNHLQLDYRMETDDNKLIFVTRQNEEAKPFTVGIAGGEQLLREKRYTDENLSVLAAALRQAAPEYTDDYISRLITPDMTTEP